MPADTWTPAADAALQTAAALGHPRPLIARAVLEATGWRPSPASVTARAAERAGALRAPGRPRLDLGSRARLEVRLDPTVLGTLAEVAAAAGVSPAALAAQVLSDWARAGGAP